LDYQQAMPEENGMPTNEEGEFELVLGNKQLLSVFFVAVLLLGVFFIMGYIVGRNLSPEPALVAEGTRALDTFEVGSVTPAPTTPPVRSAVPEPDKPAAMPEPKTSAQVVLPKPIEAPKKAEVKAETKPVEVKPVEAPKTVEAPKKGAEKAAEAKPTPPKPVEATKPAAATAPTKGGSGDRYWQVVAALPGKVPGFVSGLTAKGFKVITQPVPGQELVRILVGPYDAASAADGAAKLKAAGYEAIPKRISAN
jgi:outer membrane biosynthesis protein TonB